MGDKNRDKDQQSQQQNQKKPFEKRDMNQPGTGGMNQGAGTQKPTTTTSNKPGFNQNQKQPWKKDER